MVTMHDFSQVPIIHAADELPNLPPPRPPRPSPRPSPVAPQRNPPAIPASRNSGEQATTTSVIENPLTADEKTDNFSSRFPPTFVAFDTHGNLEQGEENSLNLMDSMESIDIPVVPIQPQIIPKPTEEVKEEGVTPIPRPREKIFPGLRSAVTAVMVAIKNEILFTETTTNLAPFRNSHQAQTRKSFPLMEDTIEENDQEEESTIQLVASLPAGQSEPTLYAESRSLDVSIDEKLSVASTASEDNLDCPATTSNENQFNQEPITVEDAKKEKFFENTAQEKSEEPCVQHDTEPQAECAPTTTEAPKINERLSLAASCLFLPSEINEIFDENDSGKVENQNTHISINSSTIELVAENLPDNSPPPVLMRRKEFAPSSEELATFVTNVSSASEFDTKISSLTVKNETPPEINDGKSLTAERLLLPTETKEEIGENTPERVDNKNAQISNNSSMSEPAEKSLRESSPPPVLMQRKEFTPSSEEFAIAVTNGSSNSDFNNSPLKINNEIPLKINEGTSFSPSETKEVSGEKTPEEVDNQNVQISTNLPTNEPVEEKSADSSSLPFLRRRKELSPSVDDLLLAIPLCDVLAVPLNDALTVSLCDVAPTSVVDYKMSLPIKIKERLTLSAASLLVSPETKENPPDESILGEASDQSKQISSESATEETSENLPDNSSPPVIRRHTRSTSHIDGSLQPILEGTLSSELDAKISTSGPKEGCFAIERSKRTATIVVDSVEELSLGAPETVDELILPPNLPPSEGSKKVRKLAKRRASTKKGNASKVEENDVEKSSTDETAQNFNQPPPKLTTNITPEIFPEIPQKLPPISLTQQEKQEISTVEDKIGEQNTTDLQINSNVEQSKISPPVIRKMKDVAPENDIQFSNPTPEFPSTKDTTNFIPPFEGDGDFDFVIDREKRVTRMISISEMPTFASPPLAAAETIKEQPEPLPSPPELRPRSVSYKSALAPKSKGATKSYPQPDQGTESKKRHSRNVNFTHTYPMPVNICRPLSACGFCVTGLLANS